MDTMYIGYLKSLLPLLTNNDMEVWTTVHNFGFENGLIHTIGEGFGGRSFIVELTWKGHWELYHNRDQIKDVIRWLNDNTQPD